MARRLVIDAWPQRAGSFRGCCRLWRYQAVSPGRLVLTANKQGKAVGKKKVNTGGKGLA